MAKLQAYASTAAGKRRMKDYINDARDNSRRLASGQQMVGPKQMAEMANALVGIIRRKLPQQIAEVGNTLVASAPVKNPDGSYSVTLSFSTEALHRDSLDNDLGYEGINNIVALFNNGYHAKNYVYGWWEGHRPIGEAISRGLGDEDYAWVRSQKEREGLHFMQEAAEEFNAAYGVKYNVFVQLGSDYGE